MHAPHSRTRTQPSVRRLRKLACVARSGTQRKRTWPGPHSAALHASGEVEPPQRERDAVNSQQYAARRAAFRKLHESGCFMLPNPCDVGTARYLKRLGFKALASTSSGFAWSRGLPDHAVDARHGARASARIVAATDLPVNADFEHGYADDPAESGRERALAVATGVAGVSIEDSTNDKSKPPLYELARSRRAHARRARGDRRDRRRRHADRPRRMFPRRPVKMRSTRSIRRLQAYAEAGADCLYAPGVRKRERPRSVGQSGRAEAVQPSRRRRVAADAR